MKNGICVFSILWVAALTVAHSFGASEPDDVAAAKARQWEPIFCLDRKILTNYADVGRERRTGYGWYGYWPSDLLEKVIVWRKQNTAD